MNKLYKKIGLSGGGHLVTEAIFQSIDGVIHVDQGWIASNAPNEQLSEGVVLTFDPKIITETEILRFHLLTHSSQFQHKTWDKYRSAIYVYSNEQFVRADQIIEQLQDEFDHNLITQVLNFVSFKQNKSGFLNYYQKNPNAPFCRNYIQPKLDFIKHLIKRENAKLG